MVKNGSNGKERIVLMVEKGISSTMIELAGGERKRGTYISKLVREEANRHSALADYDALRAASASHLSSVHNELDTLVGDVADLSGDEKEMLRLVALGAAAQAITRFKHKIKLKEMEPSSN